MYRGEYFNSITHLVGAVLVVGAVALMITHAAIHDDGWKITGVSIYGVTLIILYLFSTLYHSLRGAAKRVFRVLDHQAIYLLIAGTYTPFALVTLRDSAGWWLLGVNWTLAAIGIVLDAVRRDGRRIVPMLIYVVMGWMIVFVLEPVQETLPAGGFDWLLAGGLFYTAGITFYVLDHWYKWAHGIWHLFVMAGSSCHYVCVLLYV
ncbi:MAG: hemolysin III family protein [Gammaproteobacteria bacterium]